MSQAYKPLPPASRLWELFEYSPLTGELHWIDKTGPGKTRYGCKPHVYAHARIDSFYFKTHRLVWAWMTGEDPGSLTIDHKDRNRHNNRFWNLQIVHLARQAWNKGLQSNNLLGVRGVNRTATGRYMARIRKHGKSTCLGTYDTIEEASAVYEAAFASRLTEVGERAA